MYTCCCSLAGTEYCDNCMKFKYFQINNNLDSLKYKENISTFDDYDYNKELDKFQETLKLLTNEKLML